MEESGVWYEGVNASPQLLLVIPFYVAMETRKSQPVLDKFYKAMLQNTTYFTIIEVIAFC